MTRAAYTAFLLGALFLLFTAATTATTTPQQEDLHRLHADKKFRAQAGRSDGCDAHPWPYPNNTMYPGMSLKFGEYLESSTALLLLTYEGNLKIVRKDPTPMVKLWESNTSSTGATEFTFTKEGQLQLLDSRGKVVWQTNKTSASIAVLQDDCNFVLYEKAPMENVQWSTNSQMCVVGHIVAHSHDDVGWLLSPERYYDGCHSVGAGVRAILTSVVAALAENPERRFTEVEMYFFNRWWLEQNSTTQALVKRLVRNGQLEFVNAGWSMHDEACVHQESAISNMEVGNRFLRETFGNDVNVSVGWHIDPFGHASATPRLFAQMGFNAFFFWRTDYQHRNEMYKKKTMESMWFPSDSLGEEVGMFTSIMYDDYCMGCRVNSTYNGFSMCPVGFCCFNCEEVFDGPAQSELLNFFLNTERRDRDSSMTYSSDIYALFHHTPEGVDYTKEKANKANVKGSPLIPQLAASYAKYIRHYAGAFRTNQVLVPWGCDFAHMVAQVNYGLMDLVLAEINSKPETYGIRMFYSTPTRYVNAVQSMQYTWPVNRHDYFLDSDNGHAYWSGYFTSRPEFKGFERNIMNQRSTTDILLSTLSSSALNLSTELSRVEVLREALGVAQHHDCITGTERKSVRNQYEFILTRGMVAGDQVMEDLFQVELGLIKTQSCPLANISNCKATDPLSAGKNVSVYLYNPLLWERDEIVTVPVPIPNVIALHFDNPSTVLMQQVVETWNMTTTVDNTSPFPQVPQLYQISFSIRMRPRGFTQVILVAESSVNNFVATERHRSSSRKSHSGSRLKTIENEYYQIQYDEDLGRVQQITNLQTNMTSPFSGNIKRYCPHNDTFGQASGAYIFRTCEVNEIPVSYTETPTIEVIRGPLCSEVRQYLDEGSHIQQSYRLCRNQSYVELTSGIGELDPLNTGVEVILQMQTDIRSRSTWYTDSQGLEMQTRVRCTHPNYPFNCTEPIASNFYPSNAFVFINESDGRRNMAIVQDRSRAAASLSDGELEFLVHRRLLFDDHRGVNQALNEETRVISTSRLMLHEPAMHARMRQESVFLTHPLYMRFGPPLTPPLQKKFEKKSALRSATTYALPPNVHLHTMTLLNGHSLVLRLQHLIAKDESMSSNLNVPVKLLLSKILPRGMKPKAVTETDLNGLVPLTQLTRLPFRVTENRTNPGVCYPHAIPSQFPLSVHPLKGPTQDYLITLNPMDIRTYIVDFEWL